MRTDDVSYDIDGQNYVGYLVAPDGDAPRAGVLVCHEGGGLEAHAKDRADRLASELGVIAFALDYFGDGKPPPPEQVMDRLAAMRSSADGIRKVARAGLAILTAQPHLDRSRVAAIGYCFGGTMALELARGGDDLAAVVGFHSGLATTNPAQPGVVKASVLTCIGAEDPLVPADQRIAFEDEMRAAGADWQMVVYGGAAHSFTNPAADGRGMPGVQYHAPTDARSWQAMCDLFADKLGTPPAGY
jgi:dienelactone hydrolase